MNYLNTITACAMSILLPVSAVQADTPTPSTQHGISATSIPQNHFGIGLDLSNSPSLYKAQDNDHAANIHLKYRGQKFNMGRDSMSYKFLDKNKFQLEALLKSETRGYEASSAKALAGLSDRDESLDLGFRAGYKTTYGLLSLDATQDVSNTHKGHEADLRFGPDFYNETPSAQKKLALGVVAGLKWQSKEVVDYYYGVKSSEATASRAAYQGNAATTPYIGLDGKMNLSKKLSLSSSVLYMDRPDEISKSPLVDNDHNIQINAGLTYWFH